MPKNTIRTGYRQTSGNEIPRLQPQSTQDYLDNLADTTASNYSMQPGKPRSQSNVPIDSATSDVTHRDPEPSYNPNEN